jgi:predicted small secreted protein
MIEQSGLARRCLIGAVLLLMLSGCSNTLRGLERDVRTTLDRVPTRQTAPQTERAAGYNDHESPDEAWVDPE